MRTILHALLAMAFLAGCTMPGAPDDSTRLETSAGERAAEPAPAAQPPAIEPPAEGTKPAARPVDPPLEAPPMSEPMPPEPVPAANLGAPDRSCRTSADCVVKNVGNCCGAMPACVNTNAKVDPAAVQAQCARQGMSSVCGFKEVTSCSCVAGTCQDGGEVAAQ